MIIKPMVKEDLIRLVNESAEIAAGTANAVDPTPEHIRALWECVQLAITHIDRIEEGVPV